MAKRRGIKVTGSPSYRKSNGSRAAFKAACKKAENPPRLGNHFTKDQLNPSGPGETT